MKTSALLACAALAAAAVFAPGAHADTYPSRPLTLVIPFPPGGATDVVGRLVGKTLGDKLGQPVVIDNRAGAGTIIGATYTAKAAPDGYTLLISSGTTFTVNPALQSKLAYDPLKSFDAIGLVARTGLILLANKDVPAANPKQYVDLVRAAPDKYSYASFGTGTTAQFTGELMLRATGTKMVHIPYKGSAPAMTDLMGGQVPFSVDTVSAAIPQLKTGKIKAIAVTTKKRSALLPDVPTFAESGFDLDADTWIAVVAPHGLPADVKAKLEKALQDTIATPEVREKLVAAGLEPAWANGAAATSLIEKELPLMRAIATRANIRAE
ncbi:tripartite tricarboxylate transporter substrate binding protein [Xylophilus sp. GOD-11R]|uniref:Bug family tripartite tricarboxylate transporter substrate binding protein n=1 Tax=Xylophilus sp. GOD-11R TaxID=3089814 RepID=UPI00298CA8FA|nr:tripartite tricarboxylate transporter substrate binding protein [Xylophilus sp. GOD-11R]WPB56433.1 tripartite tricarboxylate transporter substrate binding protein [Xylophilus sp. GOD-11R]